MPKGSSRSRSITSTTIKNVRAVVLRVNSPGGTVTASDYLYHHCAKCVEELKIPIVVSMGGIAASGGYYIAMAVGEAEKVIYAEPTTWTGSIGVIIPHYNVAGLMKTLGGRGGLDQERSVEADGHADQADDPRREGDFQHLVDDSFHRFKDIVKQADPALAKDADALAKVTTGQVFTTGQAIANGLVDSRDTSRKRSIAPRRWLVSRAKMPKP